MTKNLRIALLFQSFDAVSLNKPMKILYNYPMFISQQMREHVYPSYVHDKHDRQHGKSI